MDTIGAFEAKTHLSSLLERVAQGESFTITRHGKPVARLVPAQQRDPEQIKATIRRMKEIAAMTMSWTKVAKARLVTFI